MTDVDGFAVLLDAAAGITHSGQPDQAAHALRCATLAADDGADPDLIVVALIHDLAKPLSVVRHGETMAEAMTGRLSTLHLGLLRVHGRYVADLNHRRRQRPHLGDPPTLAALAMRFARWDYRSSRPTGAAYPGFDEFVPQLERVLAR